jgi:hypothetical protein
MDEGIGARSRRLFAGFASALALAAALASFGAGRAAAEDPYIAAKRAAAETLQRAKPAQVLPTRGLSTPTTTYPITVRLSWNGTVDLDLYAITPGGQEIYYGRTTDSTTGGRLRWDLIPSSSCTSSYRDEYIDFSLPTSGTYVIKVNFYSTRTCATFPISYAVEATYNGRTDRVTGSYISASQAVATGSGGGTEVLRFTYGGDTTTTVSFTGVTSCTGDYIYVVPHLSTERDGATSTSTYTSVVVAANHNSSSTATVYACGYQTDGTLIGGTSFSLPPGYRVFALNPASSTQTALTTLFNTTALPTQTSFHAIVRSNVPLVVQGGFVGASGQFFAFENAARTGTVLGQAHMGQLGSYPGVLFLSNTGSAATSASLNFYTDTGRIAATTQSYRIPANGRTRLDLGSITDPSGAAITVSDYYSMRVTGTDSSSPIAGWNASVVTVGSVATVSISALQVLE